MTLVGDVMQRDVYTVTEDERLDAVLREMLSRGIRHAPVVREARVVGVLTDRNLLGHRARFGRDGDVASAMTEEPFVTDPQASLPSASALMATHKIGCLPVVEAGKLVGIVTTTDLLTELAQEEIPQRPLRALKVRDVMQPKVVSVHEGDGLLDAAFRMFQYGVRHLPVLDGDKVLIGVLSDRDVRGRLGDLRPLVAQNETGALDRLRSVSVSEVMTREPVVARPNERLDHIADRLVDAHVGALPVVGEDSKLLGIVSYVDVLRALRAGD